MRGRTRGREANPVVGFLRLAVKILPTGNESFLLAIDPTTGKDLWRNLQPSDAVAESREAFSTPLPFTHQGYQELVMVGGDAITGTRPDEWPRALALGRVESDAHRVLAPRAFADGRWRSHSRVCAVLPGARPFGVGALAWLETRAELQRRAARNFRRHFTSAS